MSTALKELIYSIGQEEHVENLDQGITFTSTITTEDFVGLSSILSSIRSILSERNLTASAKGNHQIMLR